MNEEVSSLAPFPRSIVGTKARLGLRRTPLKFRQAARTLLALPSNATLEIEAKLRLGQLTKYDEVVWAMVKAAIGDESNPPNTRACEVLIRAVGEAGAAPETPDAFRIFVIGGMPAPPPAPAPAITVSVLGEGEKGGRPPEEREGVRAGGPAEEEEWQEEGEEDPDA